MLAALALPGAASHSLLPLNGVSNAGFENGTVGWSSTPPGFTTVAIAPGGAQATLHRLSTPNQASPSFVTQPLGMLVPAPWITTFDSAALLDFDARMTTAPTFPVTWQYVTVASGAWDPATGAGQVTAQVGLLQHDNAGTVYATIRVAIYSANTHMGYYGVSGPSDSEWHHYQLQLNPTTRTGALYVDGSLLMQVAQPGYPSGSPVAAPDRILLGDMDASDATLGPTPDVSWDEIYFGPGELAF